MKTENEMRRELESVCSQLNIPQVPNKPGETASSREDNLKLVRYVVDTAWGDNGLVSGIWAARRFNFLDEHMDVLDLLEHTAEWGAGGAKRGVGNQIRDTLSQWPMSSSPLYALTFSPWFERDERDMLCIDRSISMRWRPWWSRTGAGAGGSDWTSCIPKRRSSLSR